MHPLEKPIEVSLDIDCHRSRGVIRRRSSLDNSCLSASETFALSLLIEDKSEFDQKPRRLSLGAKLDGCCVNTTFLAVSKTPSEARESKVDLDADGHATNFVCHTTRSRPSWHSKASKASDTINTSSVGSLDIMALEEHREGNESDNEDSSFSDDEDSDCDSFCDASVGEPANRTYLRSELGSSVFWGEDSSGDLEGAPIHDSFGSGKLRPYTVSPRQGLPNCFSSESPAPRKVPLRSFSSESPAPRQVLPRSFSAELLPRSFSAESGLSGGSSNSPRKGKRRLQVSLQVTDEVLIPGAET